MPQSVLYIVPEDEEKEHVEDDVDEASMHEHSGEQSGEVPAIDYLGGHDAIRIHEDIQRFLPTIVEDEQLVGEYEQIDQHDDCSDNWEARPRRILLRTHWHHHGEITSWVNTFEYS